MTSFQYRKAPKISPPSFRVLLESLVIGSSLGSSVLVFWYAVCHQLHQQLEGFCNVLNILIVTDLLILSLGNIMQLPEIWASFWNLGFILDFWLGSEYTYVESFIFRSIHPEVFQKIVFLNGFSKFLEKFPGRSTFQRSYRSKPGLPYGC